ncbi:MULTISPECIES: hypothetical protein [unclassified Microbacterium]|uniref:hypothetical protein n=1 Tax=unclassified Microbacterium TaxID=2609290 RepID=UPI00301B5924
MSDRIDHAAEASRLLARRALDPALDIARAQVHATLALVEQQRTANLIAVATWNANALRTGGSRDGKPADREVENARVDRLFAEIREGLGL